MKKINPSLIFEQLRSSAAQLAFAATALTGLMALLTLSAPVFAVPASGEPDIVDGGSSSHYEGGLSSDGFIGGSVEIGNSSVDTVYTNFFTRGGNGSGGGGGLGGVFFVNEGADLTLTNVSFKSNTVRGGDAGGATEVSLGALGFGVVDNSANVPTLASQASIDGKFLRDLISPTFSGFLFGLELFAENPLISAGTRAFVGDKVYDISGVTGKDVAFDGPAQITDADVLSFTGIYTDTGAGPTNRLVIPEGTVSDPNDIRVGMQVFVDNSVAGRAASAVEVTAVIRDPATNLPTEVVLSENAIQGAFDSNPMLGPIPVQTDNTLHFIDVGIPEFSLISEVTPDSIAVKGNQTVGFEKGMVLSGDGISGQPLVSGVSYNEATDTTTITYNGNGGSIDGDALRSVEGSKPGVDGNQINLQSVRGLEVGMAVSDTEGNPLGTITAVDAENSVVTLNQPVSSSFASQVSSGAAGITTSRIASVSGNQVTMVSVPAELKVGDLISGEGIPEGRTVESIDGNVVTFSNAESEFIKGGNMNGFVANGSGEDGDAGVDGRVGASFLNEGEGQEGTFGYDAGDTNGSGQTGGNGGDGGSGSDGMAFNYQLTKEIIDTTAAMLWEFAEGTSNFATFPPAGAEASFHFATGALEAVNLAEAIANGIIWLDDLTKGLVARGGDGADGGEGGDGEDFFGGGSGGAGGEGGEGGLAITDGGEGGNGGRGGSGGFGAGGGAGGPGGDPGSTGAAGDGDGGLGGDPGFGGGRGSLGGEDYGQGGSGFGGALFVRDGGVLNIHGNAEFKNNTVLAGSSNNAGLAGEVAGTDLFMMTQTAGGGVWIAPGIDGEGNDYVVTFEGSIGDDSKSSYDTASRASGDGAGLTIGDERLGAAHNGGLVRFLGVNTYSGLTNIYSGTLEADDGFGINENSRINFIGSGNLSSVSSENAGVILTSGEFQRRVGNLPHQISWNGSGGFAAKAEEGLELNFGSVNNNIGQTLQWGSSNFLDDGEVLVFGSKHSVGAVTLVNDIELNGNTARIAVFNVVENDLSTGPDFEDIDPVDFAVISGAITGGDLAYGNADYSGYLVLEGANQLDNVTINQGVIATRDGGRLSDGTTATNLTINGGTLYSDNSGEKFGTVSVADMSMFIGQSDFQVDGSFTNAGVSIFNGASTVSGNLQNSGTLQVLGALNGSTIDNQSSGIITQKANINASSINNDGSITQEADIELTGGFTQNGMLAVGGSGEDARSITTTGFSGNGATYLGKPATEDALAESGDLNIIQSGNSTYSGVFDGSGDLRKQGAGRLELTGANTYTGNLYVDAGTIDLDGGNLDDGLAVTVAADATFIANTANEKIGNVTNSGTLDANATLETDDLTNNASGTVLLAAALTAADIENRGTLTQENTAATITATSFRNVSSNTANLRADVTLSQVDGYDAGTGAIEGSGRYDNSGVTNIIENVTLTTTGLSSETAAAAETPDYSGVSINIGAAKTLTIDQSGDSTYRGAISDGSGSANLRKLGEGSLTLAGLVDVAELVIEAGRIIAFGDAGRGKDAGAWDDNMIVNIFAQAAFELANGDQSIDEIKGAGTIDLGSGDSNTLYVNNGGDFTGTVVGKGSIEVASGDLKLGGINSEEGSLVVGDSGLDETVIDGGDGSTSTIRDTTVEGNLRVADGNTLETSAGSNVDGGTLELGANAKLRSGGTGDMLVQNDGEFYLGAAANQGEGNEELVLSQDDPDAEAPRLVVETGGRLTGEGTIVGSVSIHSNGRLSAGDSPGLIEMTNLDLGSGGIVDLELTANIDPTTATAGIDFDQYTIVNNFTIQPGATLNIGGYDTVNNPIESLSQGEAVQGFVFNPGAISGQFTTVNSGQIPPADNSVDFAPGAGVLFNLATGQVVGTGLDVGVSVEPLLGTTENQRRILRDLRVGEIGTNGNTEQYYGGNLLPLALAAQATAGGDAAAARVFQLASPESYAGLLDFNLAATRQQYDAQIWQPVRRLGGDWYLQIGSSYDGFETADSDDNHDYELGIQYHGLRFGRDLGRFNFDFSVGYSEGTVRSDYLDADLSGMAGGANVRYDLGESGGFALSAGLQFSETSAEGHRQANSGRVDFDSVDGNSLSGNLNLDYHYSGDRYYYTSGFGFYHASGEVDAFEEVNLSGNLNPDYELLAVHEQDDDLSELVFAFEFGNLNYDSLRYFASLTAAYALDNTERAVSANVANEVTEFEVEAPGFNRFRGALGLGFEFFFDEKNSLLLNGGAAFSGEVKPRGDIQYRLQF